jgi:hypothetical protein
MLSESRFIRMGRKPNSTVVIGIRPPTFRLIRIDRLKEDAKKPSPESAHFELTS